MFLVGARLPQTSYEGQVSERRGENGWGLERREMRGEVLVWR